MKMKMKIFIMLLMAMSFTASAQAQIYTSGLTDKQKAELKLQVENIKLANDIADTEMPKAQEVKEYAELGESIAKAIGSCAKELGVAVDDFSKTTVGKTAIGLIVWKMVGRDVVKVLVGVGFITFFVMFWIYFFRKMCVIKSVEYNEDGKKKKITNYGEGHVCGTRFAMLVVLIIIVATGLGIIFIG
jgi:hypothetical protein